MVTGHDLELVVHYPKSGGGTVCRGFRQLHLMVPVLIVFDGAQGSDQTTAEILGRGFCDELLRLTGVSEGAAPCGGKREVAGSCPATSGAACKKILVIPGGGAILPSGVSPSPAQQTWATKARDPMWPAVPVLKQGSPIGAIPAGFHYANACWWGRFPTEVLPSLLQIAGISPEENRIFISYVRKDSQAIADQLFVALGNEGFDVFLDRCSVPGGVNFQERLMQDLCDKAMIVLLNSPGVQGSKWVMEELAAVKLYRLGILEVFLPGAADRGDLDIDQRFPPGGRALSLINAGPDYPAGMLKLSGSEEAELVQAITQEHGRALHRRRYQLINDFGVALTNAHRKSQLLPDGTFLVSDKNKGHAVVGFSVRSPELGDYCKLHAAGTVSSSRPGWIVSSGPFFIAQRRAQIEWLAGVSHIGHADQSQMDQLIKGI